jgi:iron(III) transport system permease protein
LPARSTIRDAPRCSRPCCSASPIVAFWLQQRWLGKLSYVTVSGKGDSGIAAQLPRGLWYTCFGISALWIVFTVCCYIVILIGGFVKDIGRGDMTLSLSHFAAGFGIEGTRFTAPRGTASSTPSRSRRFPPR